MPSRRSRAPRSARREIPPAASRRSAPRARAPPSRIRPRADHPHSISPPRPAADSRSAPARRWRSLQSTRKIPDARSPRASPRPRPARRSASGARAHPCATFPARSPPRHVRHRASAASAAARIRCSGFLASSARGTARPRAPPESLSWLSCPPIRPPRRQAAPASRSRQISHAREPSRCSASSVSSTAKSFPRIAGS